MDWSWRRTNLGSHRQPQWVRLGGSPAEISRSDRRSEVHSHPAEVALQRFQRRFPASPKHGRNLSIPLKATHGIPSERNEQIDWNSFPILGTRKSWAPAIPCQRGSCSITEVQVTSWTSTAPPSWFESVTRRGGANPQAAVATTPVDIVAFASYGPAWTSYDH